jgi:parvulin-like peptidyl-prolyl isomerase
MNLRLLVVAGFVTALGCGATKVAGPPPMPAVSAPASAAAVDGGSTSSAVPAVEPPTAPAPVVAAPQEPAPKAAPTQGAGTSTPASSPAETSAGEDTGVLGWVAGQPLRAEELLVEWGDVASRELFLVLDKLVATRLALAEASRLAIKLAPEEVEQRYALERERLAGEVAKKQQKSGKSRTLEEFIARDLGFDPKAYLERLRRSMIRQMLAERAVRAASLAEESVALRLIVVANAEQLAKVQAALAEKRDFAAVATELSVDDSRAQGGLVPFVQADERSPLARLAFQTKVGEVAGPLPVGDHQFLIRVEERRAARVGDWSVIGEPVLASLVAHPVEDAEFLHWKLAMEDRYPIDMRPMMELIGAAGPEKK